MPSLDFSDLLLQADNLRNDGRVAEAVRAYQDIAALAADEHELIYQARAYQLAGASLNSVVTPQTASHARDANEFISQAIHIYRQLNDKTGEGAAWRDWAISRAKFGDQPASMIGFQKSLECLDAAENDSERGITYAKLAKLLASRGDFRGAEQHFDQAESFFRRQPTGGYYRATAQLDRAKVVAKQGDCSTAISQALEALSWFEADHGTERFGERQFELALLLSILYEEWGDPKTARRYRLKMEQLASKLDPEVRLVIEQDMANIFSARRN